MPLRHKTPYETRTLRNHLTLVKIPLRRVSSSFFNILLILLSGRFVIIQKMFRAKLALAIGILLSFTVILAVSLYWGAKESQYLLERKRTANKSLEAYMQLSLDASRHFKEEVDNIILLGNDGLTKTERSKQTYEQLQASLRHLKVKTNEEILQVMGREMEAEEREEINRVTMLEQAVFNTLQGLNRVLLLKSQGEETSAHVMLKAVLDRNIDEEFQPIIDEAIADERSEVEEAREDAMNLAKNLKVFAIVGGIGSVGFAIIVGVLLQRRLQAPIDALVSGTRNISRGNLKHRIEIKGRDEFTYLAKNFNKMTDDLEFQRAELLRAHANLEGKVTERTRELQETNRKLQKIDKMRRQFFADISHELRTPLTVIRGEAEVTLRGQQRDVAEYKNALTRIVDLSKQLTQLVEDLLLLARSESTSLRFNMQPVLLNEVIQDVAEDARALAHKKKLEVELEMPEVQVTVAGDALRIRQLLHIIIDNACRYSKPCGGLITIGLLETHGHALIMVQDQGIGIPAADLEFVFDRFYRSADARQKVASGVGLGLPLARSIAQTHNGNVELESKVGAGTKVTVWLPLMKDKNTYHADIND